MDRQPVRQRTESGVLQRSGQPQQRQSARSATAATAAKAPANPAFTRLSRQQSDPELIQTAARPETRPKTRPEIRPELRRRQRFRFSFLLFVLGLWSVSLITTVWATRSLLDPTLSSTDFPVAADLENPLANAEAPSPEANPAPPAPIAPPEAVLDNSYFYPPAEAEHLPIAALGMIAFSCAMSCILVSRALHPRRSPPRLQGRSAKRTAKPTLKQLPAAVESPPQPAIAKQPVPAVEIIEMTGGETAPAAAPAAVTVLPANQSLPLDWDEPSLADSLDLRRRQSLPF